MIEKNEMIYNFGEHEKFKIIHGNIRINIGSRKSKNFLFNQ